jgi:hypothetical protein
MSTCFRIDPDGVTSYLGSYVKLTNRRFDTLGSQTPSNLNKNINEVSLVSSLSKSLISKNMFGYFTLDFIVYYLHNKSKHEDKNEMLF